MDWNRIEGNWKTTKGKIKENRFARRVAHDCHVPNETKRARRARLIFTITSAPLRGAAL